ncbi:MAG TPA: RagB/SusD family nutrient uptake outer membrane protein [Flavisolibacter sp.]|nr:RagB/SusD family nutrient uptake outer membrane protein [Flavisolibacter sp.]
MKKYSIILALSAVFAGGMMTGCKKALDIEPQQSIDASTALNSKEGINAALVGIYARQKSFRLYGRDLIALPEVLADNGYANNRSGRLLAESNNQNRAHFLGDTWQLSYTNINDANLILEAAGSNPTLTAAEKASVEGQAYFLRALNHFNLALVYAYIPGAVVNSQNKGGVPLMTKGTNTTEGALANLPARAPIEEVYNQIVTDFEAANSRLTTGGVAPFTISASTPNFANKAAAQAFLSRVNLYRKNYAEAKRWSDSAVNTAGSKLTSGNAYVSGWRTPTHPETLFQVAFNTNAEGGNPNESLHTTFSSIGAPGSTTTIGFGDVVPSLYLLNDLGITLAGGNTEANYRSNAAVIDSRTADVRNLLYEPGAAGRGKVYIETTKYLGKNGFTNLDHSPVIRIAEVYLNRAEAFATPGSAVFNEALALADLNRIVVARGLTAFVGLTGTALYEEILKQRRIELAMEGHRFWDLKRLGRDIVKAPLYSGGDVPFTDYRILAPLPTRELQVAGSKLVQNTGY